MHIFNFFIILLIILIALIIVITIYFGKKNRPVDNSAQIIELKFLLSQISELVHRESTANRADALSNREELRRSLAENRTEISNSFRNLAETTTGTLQSFSARLQEFTGRTDEKFNTMTTSTEQRLNQMRETIDLKLQQLQADNAKKLDEMRATVDEKLQQSVEKRFNESFKMISERLEMVHKSMGEMQALATGVGDLKRVLTNVKTRGNLGEIQLGTILEQCLAPEQYILNAATRSNTSERVEFAVKMPGKDPVSDAVLLPIDSKFPMEDYQRLLEAYDAALPPDEIKKIQNSFESAVRKSAQDIHNKYINPPYTTDFAVMFVPTEGLYAEILRRPGLFERLQRDYKISVVGPTNLVAFLNSLQMGFRTLAIERRSSEVWALLGAVKNEFGKFGDVLEKTRNRLECAVKDIDSAGIRTRAIERKLRGVEALPDADAMPLLDSAPDNTGNLDL